MRLFDFYPDNGAVISELHLVAPGKGRMPNPPALDKKAVGAFKIPNPPLPVFVIHLGMPSADEFIVQTKIARTGSPDQKRLGKPRGSIGVIGRRPI